jgi:hypothetical protein
MRNRTGSHLFSLWFLVLGPILGAVVGLFGGGILYSALRGGGVGGYYGEIGVLFEYLVIGTGTGCILGVAFASWYLVRASRRSEHSMDYLQSQLNKFSRKERDSICRLFNEGRNEEAIQITQRVLGVCRQEATAIAKVLKRPSGQ